MELQLTKAYEEILDRSFEEEAILLQNDKALEILLKINELGIIDIHDLHIDDKNLLFLLNYGYIVKREGRYYLSKKTNKFFKILGITPNQSIKNSILPSQLSPESIINYYDLRDIPEAILKPNLKFGTIDRNIFIKISEPKTNIQCKLILNCIPNLNLFFVNINNYLTENGKVTFYYQTSKQRKKYLTQTKTFIQRQTIRFSHFFGKVFNKKSNIISYRYSQAEILGRLVFNGFEIIENVNSVDYNFVVAIPKRKVSYDEGRKYSLFFKTKRIGRFGKEFYLYKFSTFYPYTEYLTDFIYQTHLMQPDGNIQDEFRISPVGKILRKCWLDELPMLINLLKGDVKIIGVRPISDHYLNLYPSDLRTKRLKFKPGFLPPYFADSPKTLEDIFKSEDEYLSKYEKNPIMTDLKYFLKSVRNILIKTS